MRYAVIPTHDRPGDLQECIDAIGPQVDYVIVIDNASYPPADPVFTKSTLGLIVRDPTQPPNLSALWNIGIVMANHLEGTNLGDGVEVDDFWIAILNDDVIVPPGWMDQMVRELADMPASAACTDPHSSSGGARLYEGPLTSVMERMVGWAFVLDGADGIMADERLKWWYGDTAIDVMARQKYGTVIVPGPAVLNRYANQSTTGLLAEQAGKDRATFESIYGPVPW